MCFFMIYLAAAKASQSERLVNGKTAAYTIQLGQCHGNRGRVEHGLITLAIQYHNFNYTLSHGAGLCTGFSPLATEFSIEQKINNFFFKKERAKKKQNKTKNPSYPRYEPNPRDIST